ncbi:TetR/AcrR family transcriptional regulator [Cumulibacter soli]|uniref:TetR/AcrR family transcriptional regulator n=1 Tax=Cumulibacter soli TaxID=2546344 RepID=UPI00141A2E8F|nr:TetR/AcrR family transcriptional regulator [Cumulibacter soli]
MRPNRSRSTQPRGDDATRQRLLDSAGELFSRQGFKGTPISDIADHAGVARPTFYVYFSSREDVLRELANRVRSEVSLAQHEAAKGTDPKTVIRSSITAALDVYTRNAGILTVIQHQALVDPHVSEAWDEIVSTPVRSGRAFIDGLAREGKALPAASAEALSEAAVANLIHAGFAAHRERRALTVEELVAIYERLLGLTTERSPSGAPPPGSTVSRILAAAEEVFAERGFDGASVSDVAARARVSRPTIYTHFPSKEDLLRGVVHGVRDSFLALQEREATDDRDVLTGAVRAYLEGWTQHYGILSLIEHRSMSDPSFSDLLDDVQFRLHRRHERYLERLRHSGRATPLLAPTVVAEVITGATRQFAQGIVAGRLVRVECANDLADLMLKLANLIE